MKYSYVNVGDHESVTEKGVRVCREVRVESTSTVGVRSIQVIKLGSMFRIPALHLASVGLMIVRADSMREAKCQVGRKVRSDPFSIEGAGSWNELGLWIVRGWKHRELLLESGTFEWTPSFMLTHKWIQCGLERVLL